MSDRDRDGALDFLFRVVFFVWLLEILVALVVGSCKILDAIFESVLGKKRKAWAWVVSSFSILSFLAFAGANFSPTARRETSVERTIQQTQVALQHGDANSERRLNDLFQKYPELMNPLIAEGNDVSSESLNREAVKYFKEFWRRHPGREGREQSVCAVAFRVAVSLPLVDGKVDWAVSTGAETIKIHASELVADAYMEAAGEHEPTTQRAVVGEVINFIHDWDALQRKVTAQRREEGQQ